MNFGLRGPNLDLRGMNLGLCAVNLGLPDVNLRLRGPNLGLRDVNLRLRGPNLGLRGMNLGLRGVNLDLRGVNLGLRGVNLGLRGVNLGLCHVNRAPAWSPERQGRGKRRNCSTTRGDPLVHEQPGVANEGNASLKNREYRGRDRCALFKTAKYASNLASTLGKRRKLSGSRGVRRGEAQDSPGIRPLWMGRQRQFDVNCGESLGSVHNRGGCGA